MPKIAIGIRLQSGPWGGGNQFLRALRQALHQAGWETFDHLRDSQLDLILLTDPRKNLRSCAFNHLDIRNYRREVNPRAVVVHRVNECDERKQTQGVNDLLAEANAEADHTIFVSRWLQQLHAPRFPQNGESDVVLNGSDPEVFHDLGQAPWDEISPLRLVTHHFGNHWNKGFDLYQRLDEWMGSPPPGVSRFEFTYIGKVPEGFQFRHARYVEPLAGEELRRELVQHHVYVTASRFEPGPNHQNEGALCGLPLLFLRHASLPEYGEGFGVGFDTVEGFLEALEEMRRRYVPLRAGVRSYPYTAARAVGRYMEIFNQLLAQGEAGPQKRRAQAQVWARRIVPDWVNRLAETVPILVDSLRHENQTGAYRLSKEGVRPESSDVAMGFTCFALKTYYTLQRWDTLPESQKNEITRCLQNYQRPWVWSAGWCGRGAFMDPAAMRLAVRYIRTMRSPSASRWLPGRHPDEYQCLIYGETKQAMASLYQVGQQPRWPFQGFPRRGRAIRRRLQSYDWSRPWAAGGQAACLAVFVAVQPEGLGRATGMETMRKFYRSLVNAETGAYFTGPRPDHGECVNGAMKVLTALDWLEEPIHVSEKLIDYTLAQAPQPTGCHLVDAVYVLYRCARETSHRRIDIQRYVTEVLAMIQSHVRSDGGLSYFSDKGQGHYYGIPITESRVVSDLHGTSLLTWAIAMCLELLEANALGWKVMRP